MQKDQSLIVAFALPDGDDKALRDALVWVRKAKEIDGGVKVYEELVERSGNR